MFASKITATANALNVAVTLIRDPAKLNEQEGDRLIVDLNQEGALAAAAAWKLAAAERRAVTGFVSHVDAETIRAARAAGIDRVMPRSKFVEELEAILRG